MSVLQVNDGTGDTMSPDGLSGVGSSGCSGFTGFFVDSTSDKGTGFVESRDLLWPIPTYEIQHSNGAIEQNPGW